MIENPEKYTLQYCMDNLPEVGSGSTRAVFLVDDSTVVKIPFVCGGYTQCQIEINVYEKYKDVMPLCKILPGSSRERVFQEKALNFEECYMNGDDDNWNYSFDLIFWEAFESDGTISISEYLDSIRDDNDSRLMEFMDKMNKINIDVVRDVCYDISCYNIGLIDNSIVIVDYGYPESLIKDDMYFVETEEQRMLQ